VDTGPHLVAPPMHMRVGDLGLDPGTTRRRGAGEHE
jgi:hypothetical protein